MPYRLDGPDNCHLHAIGGLVRPGKRHWHRAPQSERGPDFCVPPQQ
jgi:hypothetical protein